MGERLGTWGQVCERAAAGLIERHGQDTIADVDILITHTQMPDMPFYGGGGGMVSKHGGAVAVRDDFRGGGGDEAEARKA